MSLKSFLWEEWRCSIPGPWQPDEQMQCFEGAALGLVGWSDSGDVLGPLALLHLAQYPRAKQRV